MTAFDVQHKSRLKPALWWKGGRTPMPFLWGDKGKMAQEESVWNVGRLQRIICHIVVFYVDSPNRGVNILAMDE